MHPKPYYSYSYGTYSIVCILPLLICGRGGWSDSFLVKAQNPRIVSQAVPSNLVGPWICELHPRAAVTSMRSPWFRQPQWCKMAWVLPSCLRKHESMLRRTGLQDGESAVQLFLILKFTRLLQHAADSDWYSKPQCQNLLNTKCRLQSSH